MCSFSWLWKGPSTLESANSNSKGIFTAIETPKVIPRLEDLDYRFFLSIQYFFNQSSTKQPQNSKHAIHYI